MERLHLCLCVHVCVCVCVWAWLCTCRKQHKATELMVHQCTWRLLLSQLGRGQQWVLMCLMKIENKLTHKPTAQGMLAYTCTRTHTHTRAGECLCCYQKCFARKTFSWWKLIRLPNSLNCLCFFVVNCWFCEITASKAFDGGISVSTIVQPTLTLWFREEVQRATVYSLPFSSICAI